jgi:glycerol-3-phosphate acyltransferase PlsY
MPRLWLLVLIPIAYVVGSIPFGLMVGLAKGIDPRKIGSGNIGATNVGRALGRKFFLIVFFLDMLKGMIPVIVARLLFFQGQNHASDYVLWLLVGFAAILGHMFSPFLGFKGGKGVATSAGVVLGVFPWYTYPGLIAIAVWCVLFAAKRYVSLASMVAAAVFPVAYLAMGVLLGWPIFREQLPLLIFATLVAAMIVFKHRTNITRLRAGTESRFAKGT